MAGQISFGSGLSCTFRYVPWKPAMPLPKKRVPSDAPFALRRPSQAHPDVHGKERREKTRLGGRKLLKNTSTFPIGISHWRIHARPYVSGSLQDAINAYRGGS
ncbi:hypothetical protein B296_00028304 [Ensete ventricosum]|uniref:Uncharacterized protein n=1 Tax=Ensete ventricosum TaxID=4639 RepID=A0A427AN53_ENSVE|nr:hypothetical protein B296_00028304 [Ensete ventricosum]